MKFLHVYWFKKIIKLNKSVSHLIVDVVMLTQINLLINNKLLFHSELKNCKLYHSNCRLTQYFNCQKYNHIIKVCYNIQKCSVCTASEHSDYNCLLKNSLFMHYCVNCNLEHSAWFIKCRICKEQLEKIWLTYIIKFRKFVIVISENHSTNICFSTFFSFTFMQISQDFQNNL